MDDFLDIEDVGGLVEECKKDVEEKMKRVLNLLFIFPRHPSYIPLLSPLHPLCPKKSSIQWTIKKTGDILYFLNLNL